MDKEQQIYRVSDEEHPRGRGSKWKYAGAAVIGGALGGAYGVCLKWAADEQKREDERNKMVAATADAERWSQAQRDPGFVTRQTAMDERINRALGKSSRR